MLFLLLIFVLGHWFNVVISGYLTVSRVLAFATALLAPFLVLGIRRQAGARSIVRFTVVIFTPTFIGLCGLFSTMGVEGTIDLETAGIIASWPALSLTALVGWLSVGEVQKEKFRLLCGCALSAVVVVLLVWIKYGGYESVGQLRLAVNGRMPNGINGFLYAAFMIQLFVFAHAFRWKELQVLTRVVVIGGLVGPILLGLVLGSRQYLSGVALVMLFWILSKWRTKGMRRESLVVFGICLIIILIAIGSSSDLRFFIGERLDESVREWEGGVDRIRLWGAAFNRAASIGLLGKGIGEASETVGHAVDSGLLEMIIDYGWLAVVALGTVVCLLVSRVIKGSKGVFAECRINEAKVMSFGCLVGLLWFGAFNEVIREYLTWFVVASATAGQEAVIRPGTRICVRGQDTVSE